MYCHMHCPLHFILMFYHLVLFYQLHFSKLQCEPLGDLIFSFLSYFFSLIGSHPSFRHYVHYVDYRYLHSCHSGFFFCLACVLCALLQPSPLLQCSVKESSIPFMCVPCLSVPPP